MTTNFEHHDPPIAVSDTTHLPQVGQILSNEGNGGGHAGKAAQQGDGIPQSQGGKDHHDPCNVGKQLGAVAAGRSGNADANQSLDVTRIKGDLELAASGNQSALARAEKEVRELSPEKLHKLINALNTYYGPYKYGMPHIAVKTDVYGNVLELDFVPAKAATQHEVDIHTTKEQQNECTFNTKKPVHTDHTLT